MHTEIKKQPLSESPWQLRMFQKTLKKKLRLKAFTRLLGSISQSSACLLVTCGDNNGAINYYLRQLGGNWYWADLESEGLTEMAELLDDEVRLARADALPFPDEHFDYVLSIDVHEHIQDPDVFSRELHRVSRSGGRVLITTPGGDQKKVVNRLKNLVGMTKDQYGHVRDGLGEEAIKSTMNAAHFRPMRTLSFSRFFTEMLELSINFAYVKVLSSRGKTTVKEGTIAPQTQDQLRAVEKTYRMYALIYPFFWLVSQLDALLFFTEGYVVMVEGQKDS